MKNCDMKLTGNILTITVDIAKDYGCPNDQFMITEI